MDFFASGCFGSQAVVQHVTTQTSAFERLADVQIKSRSKARIERLLSLIAVIQIAENRVGRRAANGCDLNRWMQHLNSNYREGGVVNEAQTEKIYH